jgi:hypothetical protein
MFPSTGSAGRRFAFLHRVLQGEFPCFDGTIKALRLPAVHPAALRCLRLAVPRLHSLRSLLDGRVRRRSPELVTRCLRPGCCRGNDRISQVPGEPRLSVCACSNPTPAGLLAPDHYGAAALALGTTKAKAPTKGLSKLNSMAFGLAVYASQDGLPRHHARRTSGRWSGATGRAFHSQGSVERFQICILTSHSPFPSFAWRNVVDLVQFRSVRNRALCVIDLMTEVPTS